jgi:hypothetical protein
MKHIWVETIGFQSPYGAKGIAATVSMPPAPGTANAIYEVIGVRIIEIPKTMERMLEALKVKKSFSSFDRRKSGLGFFKKRGKEREDGRESSDQTKSKRGRARGNG